MPKTWYSYRMRRDVAMLTASEEQSLWPHLQGVARRIKAEMDNRGVGMEEVQRHVFQKAMTVYSDLTGERLEHWQQLYCVAMSAYGPPCPECGRPFRTPRAKLCAECGFELPAGSIASDLGRLEDY